MNLFPSLIPDLCPALKIKEKGSTKEKVQKRYFLDSSILTKNVEHQGLAGENRSKVAFSSSDLVFW